MAVVEQDLGAGLGEAGELRVDGPLEAVFVGLEGEGAGEEVGVLVQRAGSEGGTRRMEAMYFSMRACSKPASVRSWEARTKAPGRPRTADLRVEKSPPVSGARNMTACWASSGTVTKAPSSRTFVSQVSMRMNQLSGGGLVLPRRKTQIRRYWTDCVGGQVGVKPELVAGLEIGDRGDGQGLPVRVTRTSILGPMRSKRASACAWFAAAEKRRGSSNRSDTLRHTTSLDARRGYGEPRTFRGLWVWFGRAANASPIDRDEQVGDGECSIAHCCGIRGVSDAARGVPDRGDGCSALRMRALGPSDSTEPSRM